MYIDILLSQRFLPERGGSITWMYEVYRRWPNPVHVITHDYHRFPPTSTTTYGRRKDFSKTNLRVLRSNILMSDWGLDNLDSLKCYYQMHKVVKNLISNHEEIRIHCTHALPEVLSLLPLKLFSKKKISIICYAHGEEITACKSSRQLTFLYKKAINLADKVIANSENTKKLLLPYCSTDKVEVVNPGVDSPDPEQIISSRKEWREENNISEDSIVLLSLGRLEKRKNHAAVIYTASILKDLVPNFHYLIAGTGKEDENLRKHVQALGAQDVVRFLGAVSENEKRKLLAACDIFVMPSVLSGTDVEGFGIAFLEAASYGRPAIAGNVGGQEEAVIHQKTGLVIDGTSENALTNSIKLLIEDKSLRHKLGENGREFASGFSWDSIAERIYHLTENLK